MRRFAEPLVGQRANPRPLLFRGARLVDPAADTDTPGDLLVVDGRIVAAGPGIAAPEGAEIIECAGAVLARSGTGYSPICNDWLEHRMRSMLDRCSCGTVRASDQRLVNAGWRVWLDWQRHPGRKPALLPGVL